MQRFMQMLADRAGEHWCSFRRGGKPCDHQAVTFLVPIKAGCLGGWACADHEGQMVASGGWQDARGS